MERLEDNNYYLILSIMDKDVFQLNIDGVTNLVGSDTNKTNENLHEQEGVISDEIDELKLDMSDEELLTLKKEYETKYAPYEGKITPRQKQNKAYLFGTQKGSTIKTAPSNLLFEATATFVPQALAKNPEPVVWSDNTEEGKIASNDIKTMLQYHADVLCLRKKLGVEVWQWGVYFIAGHKYGWDKVLNDIKIDVRKPTNLILDPDGYVDEYGDFTSWLGERIQATAKEVIELFPEGKDYITADVGSKMGTLIVYTEWWTDEYCFVTYKEKVLDKHKNEFFNYEKGKTNHFARPKKPYTFLSVFSLQEQPHDFTNLIEQNISNQDRINKRDAQIEKNLDHSNNAILMDDKNWTAETAHQGADAMEKGDPILGAKGSVERLPANALPNGILDSQNIDKDTLRSIYGVEGLAASQDNRDTTARGMILNQSHDSSRIGGGIGDALEQVADNTFNWLLQLYYVFYDETHYASIMGQSHAVEYSKLLMTEEQRRFVVSVSPNSMQPKDEITEMNQAVDLANKGWLDPINLFKKLNYPDPMETAKMVTLFKINPPAYMQQFFPESNPQTQNPQGNPPDMNPVQGEQATSLAQPEASSALGQVDINQGSSMPQ